MNYDRSGVATPPSCRMDPPRGRRERRCASPGGHPLFDTCAYVERTLSIFGMIGCDRRDEQQRRIVRRKNLRYVIVPLLRIIMT